MKRETIDLQRGFSTAVLLVIAAVVILGGIFFMTKGGDDKATGEGGEALVEATDTMEAMSESEHAAMGDDGGKDDEMSDGDGEEIPEGDAGKIDSSESAAALTMPDSVTTAGVSIAGSFETFDAKKLALAEDGDVILFFHAPWCPSCRALESDIEANLSEIPDGVHLLKTDYDSETDLKKKYGVVRQHTLVQVDSNGDKIVTFTGLSNTLAQVITQIQ